MTSCYINPLRIVLALLLIAYSVQGQETIVSPVSGFLQVECLGGSDTRASIPFHPVPVWRGALVALAADPGNGTAEMTVNLPTSIVGGQLTASLHYALCREAVGQGGSHFPIVAHENGAIVVEVGTESLTLSPGSIVEIFRGWTLNELFPPGVQEVFHVSSGRLAMDRQSELLLFNHDSQGINLAPSRRYFISNEGWLEAATFAPAGDVPIFPGESFIVRHPAGSAATTFTASQQVYSDVVSLPLRVSSAKRQDTTVAPVRPVKVLLQDLDLTSFEESASDALTDRRDELLVYDNLSTGINKTPSAIFFRRGGQWIEDSPGFPNADGREIEPSIGLLFRKAEGAADLLARWPDVPSYDVTLP